MFENCLVTGLYHDYRENAKCKTSKTHRGGTTVQGYRLYALAFEVNYFDEILEFTVSANLFRSRVIPEGLNCFTQSPNLERYLFEFFSACNDSSRSQMNIPTRKAPRLEIEQENREKISLFNRPE